MVCQYHFIQSADVQETLRVYDAIHGLNTVRYKLLILTLFQQQLNLKPCTVITKSAKSFSHLPISKVPEAFRLETTRLDFNCFTKSVDRRHKLLRLVTVYLLAWERNQTDILISNGEGYVIVIPWSPRMHSRDWVVFHDKSIAIAANTELRMCLTHDWIRSSDSVVISTSASYTKGHCTCLNTSVCKPNFRWKYLVAM